MTAGARIVFALLVAATFGAFYVAQRLKQAPTAIQDVRGPRVFSPNGDGRHDSLAVSFVVKDADAISVDVVDEQGDAVRALLADRRVGIGERVALVWDGRDDERRRVPDGAYRLRVTLRNEGRTIVMARRYRVDTTPPVPRVVGVGPVGEESPGPELLPNRAGRALIHTSPAGREPAVLIFRTDGPRPAAVARLSLADRTAVWDGTAAGRPAPAGSYLAVAQWRDAAGNLGSSVALDPRSGLPALPYGVALPGRGGITVRYLELQPPAEPVRAGGAITVGVDARGRPYRWTLRRIGSPRPVRRGRSRRTPLVLAAPRGRSAVYVFEARAAGRSAVAPVAVQAAAREPVLVVLPYMTWQGRNAVDDDGDGAPNLLDAGQPVRIGRVFAHGALPRGFTEAEGPLLSFLANHGRRFDVTTDVALAAGRGPQLAGHRGVVLPGDVRWLPRATQLALRGFVRDGGTLLLTGTDSLRREVTVASTGQLVGPTPPAPANLFGSRLRPVVRRPTTITNLTDRLALFSGDVFGGTGVFAGFPGYEATAALGPFERLQANAVTGDGQTVLVAARYGKGLEIRTGLLDFATRLNADANAGALLLRAWTLLSR